ncbi:MAG: Hsp70 family protein, partial [Edwardsiella sp. (in: enterobacteria)]
GMLKDSMANAEGDLSARMLAEQKVEAARVLESLHGALQQDSALLGEQELAAIRQAQTALQAAAAGNDTAAIEAAINALDAQTQEFAARRMDSSIRRALAGHSVDEV